MNILNKYVAFALICALKAIMDVINFMYPKDAGFFSITSGWFDMWHLAWWCILLLIGIKFAWDKNDTRKLNILKLVVLAVIALAIQLLIYNGLFKLL